MSCTDPLFIVRGNLVNIPITLNQEELSFVFTTSGVSSYPAIGDIYTRAISNIINGESVTVAQFVVTSVSGAVVTMQSYLTSNTDDNGTTIISSSGTLTRATGSGDSSISYTSFTSDNLYDTSGRTVKMRILKNVVDSPAVSDIIVTKNATLISKGVGMFQFSVAETSTYPVGKWYGVIEVYRDAADILEQRDDEVFPVIIDKNKV